MFTRKPRLRRLVASWFLLQLGTQLAWPTLSYALTSGPTAPEATSFEPVDTTDMVNLMSGDLTYNIPLLEVPGPEGGYPLNLSYHAGIQPNEEASWVGLGWSLNPGAITRNVNGYADDHQDMSQVTRDYWEGGSRTTYSVGVTLGVAKSPASVSYNLSFSQDTYKGFGIGQELGVGANYKIPGTNIGVGAKATIGHDGYGGEYAGIGAHTSIPIGNAGANGLKLTGSVGLSTNFSSVSAQGSVGLRKGPMGISMSTNGRVSFTNGVGSVGIYNNQAGRISTQSTDYGLDIPITPVSTLNLAYNYTRYWSDESNTAYTNGALYYPATYAASEYDNHAYDTYRLLDPVTENIIDNPDPDKVQGGTFPDYDDYNVVAQGLSGSMRPFAPTQGLVNRTKKDNDNTVLIASKSIQYTNGSMNYRFLHDFSNQYRQQPATNWYTSSGALAYPFDSRPVYGNNDGNFGFNPATNRLVGSKSVESFTNHSIITGIAPDLQGFIDTKSAGFTRDDNSQVGGFMITNESGVTYHYSLPAYSYSEHVYTELVDKRTGLSYNHLSKPNKYAYTWFLTAVTGPDYVDRGPKGLDASDWGYWVNFTYGKWADDYIWRNPSEGFHKDLDGAFQSFSTGKKEIYYLNSITTRTHTALFEKSYRADGKGATDLNWNLETPYRLRSSSQTYYPKLQLKLNRVLLFNNSDLSTPIGSMNGLSTTYNLTDFQSVGRTHYGKNMLDIEDIKVLGSSFLSKAIRITSFNYDYSLASGTTNSFGNDQDPYSTSGADASKGKLTLNSVSFGGVGGSSVMPPTKFSYDYNQPSASEQIQVNQVTGPTGTQEISVGGVGSVTLASTSRFNPGDILKFISFYGYIYATILNQNSSQAGTKTYPVRYLLTTPRTASSYLAQLTKNPPYLKEYYDRWGMFKSDFNPDFAGSAETGIARLTTDVSTKSVDAWCLRRVSTPLGATLAIDYSGKDYKAPVFEQPQIITNVNGGPTTTDEAFAHIGYLRLPYTYQQAQTLFSANQIIHVDGVVGYNTGDPRTPLIKGILDAYPNTWKAVSNIPLQIVSIDDRGSGSCVLKVNDLTNSIIGYAGNFYDYDRRVNWPVYIGLYMGYIKQEPPLNTTTRLGGGVKVASVSLTIPGTTKTTTYNYNNSGTTSLEPTWYSTINKNDYDTAIANLTCAQGLAAIHDFRDAYLRTLPKILAIAREIFSPGVMYGNVTVSESVSNGASSNSGLGSVAYEFTTFDKSMLGVVGSPYQVAPAGSSNPATGSAEFRTRSMAIKDMTGSVGNLKRITHYDARGKKLTETVNLYAADGIVPVGNTAYDSQEASGLIAQTAANYEAKLGAFNYQGLIKESFGDCRSIRRPDGQYNVSAIISQRETYPNIPVGSINTDFRTGIQTASQSLGFDFYSGVETKSLTVDGYGNRLVSVSTPAYRKYPALGPSNSPLANGSLPRNRNMLTQVAGTVLYKADANNNPLSVVAANIQTWSNQVPVMGTDVNYPEVRSVQDGNNSVGNVWRPWKSFAWMPTNTTTDGLTPLSAFVPYDFNVTPPPPVPWRQTSETTLYNPYSNALEAKDINGLYLAAKLGFNQSKVLVSGGPANYNEIAYTGAEEPLVNNSFSGDIRPFWPSWMTADANRPSAYIETIPTGKTHTGIGSVCIPNNQNGINYNPPLTSIDPTKAYRASVWVNSLNSNVVLYCGTNNDDPNTSTYIDATGKVERSANGWYLITLYIPPIGNGRTSMRVGVWNSSGQPIYADDFRFQPANAQVTAYVYDRVTGQVTDILDNDNLYTHYDYTSDGRLKRVSRETFQYGARKVAENSYHLARILDAVTLDVSSTGVVTLNVPEAADPISFSYDTGDGTGYRPYTSAIRPFSFATTAGTNRWIKVRIRDNQGNLRELVKHVI